MEQELLNSQVQIKSYLDYRQYLGAVVNDLKSRNLFSHRKFNRSCGFASPNYLQLVIQGKRKLSKEGARKVSQVLGLQKPELLTFIKLIEMDQETDPSKRMAKLEEVLSQPIYMETYQLNEDQLQFYSRWYNIPIRELLTLDPNLSPSMIADLLIPKISHSQAEEAIESMLRLGLLERTNNGFKVLHQNLSTGNEILSEALKAFHSHMLGLAKESLYRFRGDEREVSALTLALSEEKFKRIKAKIREFKAEILAIESDNTSSSLSTTGREQSDHISDYEKISDRRIFQMNLQLFAITETIRKLEQP